MNVLIACEFSGVVREAFRSRGHNAWSVDLSPALDDSKYHYQQDIFEHFENIAMGCEPDLLIAHPPCTYLTNAGVRHLYDHVASRNGKRAVVSGEARWEAMRRDAEFFRALKNLPVDRICVENPIPHRYAREIIGNYSQIIQPWMFGHGETKATCLWLKNLPKLVPTNVVEGREPRVHYESPGIKNGLTRAQRRSITFQGIADAMAEQWGALEGL